MASRAFLGTGLLGAGMATGASARGDQVAVWNRTRARAEPLAAHGARVAATPADAVRGAALVHIAMTADEAVDGVLAEVEAALAPDAIILDHSTTQAAATRERARRCAARGVRFLHAPVFMSPVQCRQGSGLIVVSGPEPLFAEARPALAVMTGAVHYAGADPGAAAVLKLAGNGVMLALLAGLADALAMAEAQGVDAAEVVRLYEHLDPRVALRARGAMMARGDFEPLWTLKMARKDLRLMVEAAASRRLAAWPAVGARMDELLADGEGERDVAVLGRDVRSG